MDRYDDNFAELLGYDQTTVDQIPWDFSLRKEVIMTPEFSRALRYIARMHKKCKATGQSDSLLIVAQSGVGKTTLLKHYANQFPPYEDGYRTVIPVIFINAPSNPTELNLTKAILTVFGESSGKSAADNITKIRHFMTECGCELLMIDELQHFCDRKKVAESKKVTDSFKLLMQEVQKPILLSGLPRAAEFVDSNMQLLRRSSARHEMLPFRFDKENEQRDFRGLLKDLQSRLPFPCIELHDARVAKRFFYASAGIIDYILKILDAAVQLAAEQKIQCLDLPIFAQVYKEKVWAAVPDALNPFVKDVHLRFLNRPGEPFAGWDHSCDADKKN